MTGIPNISPAKPRSANGAELPPPAAPMVEQAVIAQLLLQPDGFAEVAAILRSSYFTDPELRLLWGAMLEEHVQGRVPDALLIATRLRQQHPDVCLLISRLMNEVPVVANLLKHAQHMAEVAKSRRVVELAHQLVSEGKSAPSDLHAWLEAVPQRVAAVLGESAVRCKPEGCQYVIDRWLTEGALRHEPTGIQALDERTGGGPVYGERWFVVGAPDAGKTAFLVQLAHVFASRGVWCGMIAADEEPSDLVTRLAQRIGYLRTACEVRDPAVLAEMKGLLEALPIRFYDASWSVERAGADIARLAKVGGDGRAVLCIDSVQTVRCDLEFDRNGELSQSEAVTARTQAIRATASKHRVIALATSEMGRGGYAGGKSDERTATMALAKWSGAIEYSARVLLAIWSVPGEKDLLQIELAKNKHGPLGESVYVRLDRRSQTLHEVTYTPAPRDASAKRTAQVETDATVVQQTLVERPGLGLRELLAATKSAGLSRDRVGAALERLGSAVVRTHGKQGKVCHSIDPKRLDTQAGHPQLEAS